MFRYRFGAVVFAAMFAWLAAVLPTDACPFCTEERGPTLAGDFAQASMVLYGNFTNPKLGAGGFDGTTDFEIEKVLKSHEYLKNVKGKTLTLPRYVAQPKNKFVVFIEVYKGNLDPYRGVEVQPGSDLVKYLEGAIKMQDAPQPERLRYCFEFLNSTDFDVAMDAYREYAKADYKDYAEMARKLPADTIAAWLRDPKTPPYRYGLYSSLLGHCGNAEHAKLLREMIEDPEKRKGSGIDGMLAASIMMQPKEGWSYLLDKLKDTRQEFMFRYACLRTLRFLWDQRPDLVGKKEIVAGVAEVLRQPDMADFAIEDLRRWQRWEMTDQVLDLFNQKSHQIPVVKRAILRFALASPAASAAKFVQAQRQRDADWVKDTEEILKLEEPAPSASAQTK
jgi:hypothetical protein